MKEVIMIERTHGCMTPDRLASTIQRNCHLAVITPDSRYYIGDIGRGHKGYRVIYHGCIPVQVITMDPQDVEAVKKLHDFQFGGF